MITYITDAEHRLEALDLDVLKLIDGADVIIYDASYTDAEYLDHRTRAIRPRKKECVLPMRRG